MNRLIIVLLFIGHSSFSLFSLSYETSGISTSEDKLIDNAMQILTNRFTNSYIIENMYDILGNGVITLPLGYGVALIWEIDVVIERNIIYY